jgi:hypothetical protein
MWRKAKKAITTHDIRKNSLNAIFSQAYARKMPTVRIAYLARTTIQTELIEIQNIPCTVCQECGYEQIGQSAQKKNR